MVYEGIILIPAFILVCLSLRNYISNRSVLSFLLFLLLLFYALSILFSWGSKLLSTYYEIDYLEHAEIPVPKNIISWILVRISYFRTSFVFINLAILVSFEFELRIFNKDYHPSLRRFIYVLAAFNILFSIFFLNKLIVLFDVLLFLLTLIFECCVYIPFFFESFKNYKLASNPTFRKKFGNLMVMSISFILVLFCLLLDRIFIFMELGTYSVFYFVSWLFVLIGIITAYLGYLD
jgi:hypothetical protein